MGAVDELAKKCDNVIDMSLGDPELRARFQAPAVKLYKERVLYAAERINQISWMHVPSPKVTF